MSNWSRGRVRASERNASNRSACPRSGPSQAAALATRLAQVVDDPELARRVGAAARKAATELTNPQLLALELTRCWAAVSRPAPTPFTGLYLPEPPRTLRA